MSSCASASSRDCHLCACATFCQLILCIGSFLVITEAQFFVTAIFAYAQVSTFAINYRGHPFMESLTENRALLYSLAGAGGFVVMLALGKPAFQKPNS
jgi:hypothetical protein